MGQQDLTTIAKFKSWYDFKGNAADDNLIAQLITRRSMDILAYLDRKTAYKTTFAEYYDGTGTAKLMLRQWPVLKVNSLTIGGVAQTVVAPPSTGVFLNPYDGYPPGRQQIVSINNYTPGIYPASGFCRGNNNIYVNYDAGYCVQDEPGTIPAAAAFQITALQTWGSWMRDDGVKNAATGAALAKVTGTPATGQYAVNEGVYTFAAADTGVAVLISYSFVPATLESACLEAVAERYGYRQHIGQKSHSFQGNVTTSFDNSGLTAFVMEMIQPYKRRVPM